MHVPWPLVARATGPGADAPRRADDRRAAEPASGSVGTDGATIPPRDAARAEYDQLRQEIRHLYAVGLQVGSVLVAVAAALVATAFGWEGAGDEFRVVALLLVALVAASGLELGSTLAYRAHLIEGYLIVFVEPWFAGGAGFETRSARLRTARADREQHPSPLSPDFHRDPRRSGPLSARNHPLAVGIMAWVVAGAYFVAQAGWPPDAGDRALAVALVGTAAVGWLVFWRSTNTIAVFESYRRGEAQIVREWEAIRDAPGSGRSHGDDR